MANSLDISLEDLIKNNKQQQQFSGRGGRGGRGDGDRGNRRGGRFGRGHRNPLRGNRASPYSIAKAFSHAKDFIWQHQMFDDSMAALGTSAGSEAGAKLYISNLDFGVTNSDIKELFSEVGLLKRCTVHYDRTGHSNGTAEVIYMNKSDAFAAVKRYNNVQLDGKPMKIELIGSNMNLSAHVNFPGTSTGRERKTVVMTPGFTRSTADASIEQRGSNSWNWGRGNGSRRFRGRGRGRRGLGHGRNQAPDKSASELDKELEAYHAEAMQTS